MIFGREGLERARDEVKPPKGGFLFFLMLALRQHGGGDGFGDFDAVDGC